MAKSIENMKKGQTIFKSDEMVNIGLKGKTDQIPQIFSKKKSNLFNVKTPKLVNSIFTKINPGSNNTRKEATFLKKLRSNHLYSKTIRRTDVTKKTTVPPSANKRDILNDNEWLLELYYSLQESALKALRLSEENYTSSPLDITKLHNSGMQNELHNFASKTFRDAENKNNSSNTIYPNHTHTTTNNYPADTEDLPPAPPPRMTAMSPVPPPPLPPLPSYLLNTANSSGFTTPTQPLTSPADRVKPSYDDAKINQLLLHQIQSQNLRESPYTYVSHDYRNSPSSGFYSCSASGGSSSPTYVPIDQTDTSPVYGFHQTKTQPIIMHSVKSTQVEKPKLQTAVAPDIYVTPPPYRNNVPQPPCSAGNEYHPTPIPTTEPPSYASTIQTLLNTGGSLFLSNSRNPAASPKTTPFLLPTPPFKVNSPPPLCRCDAFDKPEQKEHKIEHQSPIPERKTNVERGKDCKVRNYSTQAFKFYMEQHIENVIKSHKQRIYRQIQLEHEMVKISLGCEAQRQMRKMLRQKESNYIRLKRAKMHTSMFEKIKLIGVGAFGEVTLVRKAETNQLYAMKTLRKADVLKKNQVAHVKAERDILAEADNEWVVKLYFSFQDVDNLYFVMEYIPGGDLMSLLIKKGIFEEDVARFYVAELTCAVESVHKMKFIHRDIKPDNILIDQNGHIKLTDFGLCTGFRWTHNSKYYENGHNREDSFDLDEMRNNEINCKCFKLKPLERRRRREHQRCLAHSLVGTPNYIAPEVLLRNGYTQLCDWWSVGVVLYEMLVGCPPFSADTPNETQHKIISWRNTLKIPASANLSPEATDLILKLCTSPDKRLGKNADEVKQHTFFASINFKKDIRKLVPPYIPKLRSSTDTSYFDEIYLDSVNNSASSQSSSFSETWNTNGPFHGFFDFTFRRFFDDVGGEIPFTAKKHAEEQDSQGAIYV